MEMCDVCVISFTAAFVCFLFPHCSCCICQPGRAYTISLAMPHASNLSTPLFLFPLLTPFCFPASLAASQQGAQLLQWHSVRVQQQHVCSLDPFPCCHRNEEADEKALLHQNTTSINLMEEERLPGHASCQHCCLGQRFVLHCPAASLFLLKYFAAMPTSPF